MKDDMCIAIVAAGSALLGSLIPTLISYFNSVKQNKFELRKTLLEKQKSVLKISIFGDNETSKSLNNYYSELMKNSRGVREPLTQAEHQKFQKEIVNGMRSNLGLEPFENFEIVGFHPIN